MSSLTHQADLIGYKRQLPKSSIGHVVVSHTDVEGKERLGNFGSTFFDLGQASDYDDLQKNAQASYIEKSSLVPWTADTSYIIPKGTIFKTSKGLNFFSVETVESRALKEPFSQIKSNEQKYADFIKAGSWDGIKYVKVPVMQGIKRTVDFGTASSTRFESFAISSLNVENASNIISEDYFKVIITPQGGDPDKVEVWEKIENIRLAGPYDKVFEAKILNNEDKVLIKFGDGITGQMIPEGSNVKVEYIETEGANGNVLERFQVTQIIFPPGYVQVDPRTNAQTKFLSVINTSPIMGGHDIQDEEDIRENAPASYLQSYSTATKSNYYEQIMKNSPVSLLHCKIFQSDVFSAKPYTRTNNLIENGVVQELSMNRTSLLITALRSNGTKLDNPQEELIDPLIKSFQDSISPNDSFDFIQPNLVEIRPNIIINTTDSISENEIAANIIPRILSKYSLFSTSFEKPYYKSDIVDIAQDFSFNKHSEVFLEAKTTASLNPIILSEALWHGENAFENARKNLLAFPFKFDEIFAQKKINPGFKNFRVNAPYIVRADVLFRERPTENKSFFLLDERTLLHNEATLLEAELLPIDPNVQVPDLLNKKYVGFEETLYFFDEYSPYFYNQQVRTAQFNFIEKITSPSYTHRMKSFSSEPFEIRPLHTDENGDNKLFPVEEVLSTERVSLNFDKNIFGDVCYRKNTQYVPDCKILFKENYSTPESIDYASGYVIVPLDYILEKDLRDILAASFSRDSNLTSLATEIEMYIKEFVTINVYALPLEETFSCEKPFDIIYSNKESILVQKNFMAN